VKKFDWKAGTQALATFQIAQSKGTSQKIDPSVYIQLSQMNVLAGEIAKERGYASPWQAYSDPIVCEDFVPSWLNALGANLDDNQTAAVVARVVASRLSQLPAADALKDPKTRLQEALQGRGLALPVYTLTAVTGDPHLQSFTISCEVPIFGIAAVGEGGSRRRAEQLAAAKLLQLLPPEMRKPA